MTLGLHLREKKASATRRLGSLLVGVAAKAPLALLLYPSTQGQADQRPGGDALAPWSAPSPKV